MTVRPNSFGICGGAYGDEGKGRIVDMIVAEYSVRGPVVVYRDNGGANAGHTVEFTTGERISFHQLPSGVFVDGAIVVLGKEMVIHPGDLLEELRQIEHVTAVASRASIKIDSMATLSLDTHRAYESALKNWQSGGKGSTGRGIAPAYADVLLRHPLRLRDIFAGKKEKLEQHYRLYQALLQGLGTSLETSEVASLSGEKVLVGTATQFIERIMHQAQQLQPFVEDVVPWLRDQWSDNHVSFVFEKAQAVGLDYRWGVYPDVTASDTTFDGIFSATEGLIHPDELTQRAGVIKATYMSSVGSRVLPTLMTGELADHIREDAHEYGATTKRPRDIAFIDIPALRFFAQVGGLSHFMLTHMDVVYPDQPIKICTGYKVGKKSVTFRPDQEFLSTVTPEYTELPTWDKTAVTAAKTEEELPKEAHDYIAFLEKEIGIPVSLITTGPQREQGFWLRK